MRIALLEKLGSLIKKHEDSGEKKVLDRLLRKMFEIREYYISKSRSKWRTPREKAFLEQLVVVSSEKVEEAEAYLHAHRTAIPLALQEREVARQGMNRNVNFCIDLSEARNWYIPCSTLGEFRVLENMRWEVGALADRLEETLTVRSQQYGIPLDREYLREHFVRATLH